jgi:hypothetical protein
LSARQFVVIIVPPVPLHELEHIIVHPVRFNVKFAKFGLTCNSTDELAVSTTDTLSKAKYIKLALANPNISVGLVSLAV